MTKKQYKKIQDDVLEEVYNAAEKYGILNDLGIREIAIFLAISIREEIDLSADQIAEFIAPKIKKNVGRLLKQLKGQNAKSNKRRVRGTSK